MCVIRELLGSGTFGAGVLNGGEGFVIIQEGYPAMQMVMPVGGFLTLGCLIAGSQWLNARMKEKEEKK
jgi:electron transport complex protein RnfE